MLAVLYGLPVLGRRIMGKRAHKPTSLDRIVHLLEVALIGTESPGRHLLAFLCQVEPQTADGALLAVMPVIQSVHNLASVQCCSKYACP